MAETMPNSENSTSAPKDYHIRLQGLKRIYERIKETGLTTKRFVLIKPREKDPVMPKDMYNNLLDGTDIRLVTHITKQDGNYGVATIGDGLIIIESDGHPLTSVLKEALPRTFTVLSGGSKNPHFYYVVEDLPKENERRMKAIPLFYGIETGTDGRTRPAHIGMVKIANGYIQAVGYTRSKMMFQLLG
jgi:hypothetical protein